MNPVTTYLPVQPHIPSILHYITIACMHQSINQSINHSLTRSVTRSTHQSINLAVSNRIESNRIKSPFHISADHNPNLNPNPRPKPPTPKRAEQCRAEQSSLA
jgi:hypothetical protein